MKVDLKAATLIVLSISFFSSIPSPAQAQCTAGFEDFDTAVDAKAAVFAKPDTKVTGEKLQDLAASEPLTSPSAVQALASSEAGQVLTTVNRPDFSSLIATAVENKLIDSSDGVYTVSLTPFSFLTLLKPNYLFDQSLYVAPMPTWFRRFGGKISLGGKGDSFDRNHDGKTDEAVQAKQLGDIVTWEVLYRVIGSRDRREIENFNLFDAAVREQFSQSLDAGARLRATTNIHADLEGFEKPEGSGCYESKKLGEVLGRPSYANALKEIGQAQENYKLAADKVFKRIDNKFLLTLAAGGSQRKEVFGPNKRSLGLRSAFGIADWNGTHAVDLEWSKMEWSKLSSFLQAPDAEIYSLGYEFSTLWLKDSRLSKDGIAVSLSGSSKWFRDVPMSKHDQNTTVNAKVTIPVSKGISLPISLTWANHKDLLTEDTVQGHIGFAIDFSQFSSKSKGSSN